MQGAVHARRRLAQLEDEKAKLLQLGRERGIALDPDAAYQREASGGLLGAGGSLATPMSVASVCG